MHFIICRSFFFGKLLKNEESWVLLKIFLIYCLMFFFDGELSLEKTFCFQNLFPHNFSKIFKIFHLKFFRLIKPIKLIISNFACSTPNFHPSNFSLRRKTSVINHSQIFLKTKNTLNEKLGIIVRLSSSQVQVEWCEKGVRDLNEI